MLRVEMHQSVNALTIQLEGRFTAHSAEHVRTLVTHTRIDNKLVIDVTEVMFIDAIGEEVLSFLKRLGAEFIAETSYALDACERLRLPIADSGISPLSGGLVVGNTDAIRDIRQC